MISETLPRIMSLTHSGASPMPAMAATRQMTESRSSHVASDSFRCSGLSHVP